MPQPIDLQTGLGRIAAAERIQQIADRASLAAQHRTTVDLQQQRVAAETQVQQTHAKSEEVEQEMRRRNPYVGRRFRGKKTNEKQANAKAAPFAGTPDTPESHHLDITV
jgi:hypothetical protein